MDELKSTDVSHRSAGRDPQRTLKRMMAALTLLLLVFAAALTLLAVRGRSSVPDISQGAFQVSNAAGSLEGGTPAPDFEARMLDGATVSLSSLKGRPVWLNFWASWCVPCKKEMPDLTAVGKEFQATGGQLIAVNMGEDKGTVQRFLETNGYSLTVAMDPAGKISAAYKVYGLPTHVFIDSAGVVRQVHVGPLTAAQMREAIRSLK